MEMFRIEWSAMFCGLNGVPDVRSATSNQWWKRVR